MDIHHFFFFFWLVKLGIDIFQLKLEYNKETTAKVQNYMTNQIS